MGATPYDGGVTFRVWAPFASDVQVQGDFNNWKPGTHLYSEGNGYWSADQSGAAVGQQYNYLITDIASGALLTHVDPYSRAFKTRGGPSLIAPSDTRYTDISYATPAWNEMVVYELHVGTFAIDKGLPQRGGTFASAATKLDYLKDLGVAESGVGSLIRAVYHLLGLRTYLTTGEQETRAWTIRAGDKAPAAAGVIHTDFERGFIKAETVAYDDLVMCGSVAAAREKGLYRMEGKEYVVQDGDVLLFKFNV